MNRKESRSREGAWIEINMQSIIANIRSVAPARERGLKWASGSLPLPERFVAPARERGLKCYIVEAFEGPLWRRSREGAWIEIL